MDTFKVTKFQLQKLSIRSALPQTRRSLSKQATLACLLFTMLISVSSTQAQLPADQLIKQLQEQIDGRVISISAVENTHFYQVRFLKSNAEVLLLTVHADTGEVVKTQKNSAKNQ